LQCLALLDLPAQRLLALHSPAHCQNRSILTIVIVVVFVDVVAAGVYSLWQTSCMFLKELEILPASTTSQEQRAMVSLFSFNASAKLFRSPFIFFYSLCRKSSLLCLFFT